MLLVFILSKTLQCFRMNISLRVESARFAIFSLNGANKYQRSLVLPYVEVPASLLKTCSQRRLKNISVCSKKCLCIPRYVENIPRLVIPQCLMRTIATGETRARFRGNTIARSLAIGCVASTNAADASDLFSPRGSSGGFESWLNLTTRACHIICLILFYPRWLVQRMYPYGDRLFSGSHPLQCSGRL